MATIVELTFSADDGTNPTMCVNITITDDSQLEGNETFNVTLTSNDPVLFDISQAVVTILNDDNEGKLNNYRFVWSLHLLCH